MIKKNTYLSSIYDQRRISPKTNPTFKQPQLFKNSLAQLVTGLSQMSAIYKL